MSCQVYSGAWPSCSVPDNARAVAAEQATVRHTICEWSAKYRQVTDSRSSKAWRLSLMPAACGNFGARVARVGGQ